MSSPGQIVILNGAPRAGKTSIVAAIQQTFDGPWMNLGVDAYAKVTPPRYRPGIGLRPGEERPDLQRLIPVFYAALYESIAAHSRLGLAVVADLGHHVADPAGRALLADCARRLHGLPVLFIGVSAPLDTIMQRRRATANEQGGYVAALEGVAPPLPVLRWQDAVVAPGLYDLEIDTSLHTPAEGAELIARTLKRGIAPPAAFERLAQA